MATRSLFDRIKTDKVASEPSTDMQMDSKADWASEKEEIPVANDMSEQDVKVTLANIQADPNSPLYSVKTFEALNISSELLKGIYAMKFQKPSKIQERALPLLLKDPPENLIGQSQSGTGKTAAFALTMLSRVDPRIENVQALCLAPSRELASQIVDVIKEMGKYTNIEVFLAAAGDARKAKIQAPIVVGTPGTIIDSVRRGRMNFKDLKVFVLDEADNMLALQGLAEQSLRAKSTVPKSCQVILFSATYPEEVERFAKKVALNANEIKLKQEELSIEGIKQFYIRADSIVQKYELLNNLYSMMTIGQSIIFFAQKKTADEISYRLSQEGHSVARLHGGLIPEDRDKIIKQFRDGQVKVLLTTNVIARGIDISQVNMVINYDLPLTLTGEPDFETYLHRIGRTGRFGRTGVSINFIHDEKSYKIMNEIQNYFGKEMIELPAGDDLEMEKILKKELKK